MKAKIETMNRFFDEQIAACAARAQALLADDRADESNFEKIRANVYDIFRRFFLQRAEAVPASWRAALDKANQHGDAERVQIELVKLDTLAKIKDKFSEVWGDAQ